MTQAESILDLDINNLRQPSENVLTAGQPTAEQFEKIKSHGVQNVLNLRAEGELDWDESRLVTELGMRYHHLPIAGKTEITFENAAKLRELLDSMESEKTLLHCGSSNRVGALVALERFRNNNGDVEKAIADGRAWGLTALEGHVRTILTEQTQ